jgi:ABC-type transport system involved in cytochrome c biogenesis permease subunit
LTNKTGFLLIIAGFILQTGGLLLRVLILMRPPLASLYETFVFVSWIIVILGTGLEILQKRNIGKLIASCGGLLFLIISDRYAVNGDTFGVIVAILNSGFWLTIHIVTISTGYAGFLISGLLGHVYLIQRTIGITDKNTRSTFQTVYMFMILGLAFTVAGTVLGGMWADQAWGRFWGWDPKENGALLLILWGAAVIHAWKGNIIGPKMTAAGAVIGILLVMLTWIGVNLLGVGLHSYGFTYSGAGMLVAVFGFEFLFLVSVGVLQLIKPGTTN